MYFKSKSQQSSKFNASCLAKNSMIMIMNFVSIRPRRSRSSVASIFSQYSFQSKSSYCVSSYFSGGASLVISQEVKVCYYVSKFNQSTVGCVFGRWYQLLFSSKTCGLNCSMRFDLFRFSSCFQFPIAWNFVLQFEYRKLSLVSGAVSELMRLKSSKYSMFSSFGKLYQSMFIISSNDVS